MNSNDPSANDEEAYITGLYRFSKPSTALSFEQRCTEMYDIITRNAKLTLVESSKRNEYQKEISQNARKQFSNRTNVARPAKLSKYIADIYPSVGQIVCGTIRATCFLVTEDIVITNNHVVEAILNGRKSDLAAYRSITIDFDFDAPRQSNATGGIEVASLDDARNIRNEALDYAFLALESKPEGKTPLGNKVKKHVPQSGLVAIVGHPGGFEKLDDTCTIIPRAEVSNHVDLSCVECIHVKNHAKNSGATSITSYLTSSMFDGSSGSPVINMSGEIVAIHCCGCTREENGDEICLLNYGFTFEAIIADVKDKDEEKMKHFFPHYN